MVIRVVSYCTPAFAGPMRAMLDSALRFGAATATGWTRRDLERTAFYGRHRAILDAPRGAGYWAWKPFYIVEALKAADDGDFILYYDAGRPENPYEVDRPLGVLTEWAAANTGGLLPGVYIPQWGPNRRWTKGECFRAMGCDTGAIRDHPQIQATFSLWRKHERGLALAAEWLDWCTRPVAISDEKVDPGVPDAPDFVEHRYDQSIITNLALKQGVRCFGNPGQVTVGANPDNSVDKRIGTLIDRIRGDTWAVRRRIALEDRKIRHRERPVRGLHAPLRRAARYASSLVDAVRHYP